MRGIIKRLGRGIIGLVAAGAIIGTSYAIKNNDWNPKPVKETVLEEIVTENHIKDHTIYHGEGQTSLEGYVTYSGIKQISGIIDKLSPALRTSIKTIYIPSPNESSVAEAQGQGRILLSPNNIRYSTIAHEAAHTLTFQLGTRIPENSSRWKHEYSKWYKDLVEFGHVEGRAASLARLVLKNKEINPFVESWNFVAGEVYRKDGFHPNAWENKTSGPRDGLIDPYGSSNYDEDIATFVAKAYTNPEFFHPLTNQSSPTYDGRYVKKLELLKDYGFISSKLYDTCADKGGN